MTQTCQGARAGKGYCCSYSLKSRRNWTCCRTASGEGNGFSELHLCLLFSSVTCHQYWHKRIGTFLAARSTVTPVGHRAAVLQFSPWSA